MIHVVAVLTAKPGQRETVLKHFAANRPNVLAEAGCIEYGAAIDTEGMGPIQTPFGADTFVVIEKWESVDHLKAHGGRAAHEGVRREGEGSDGGPGDPRAEPGVTRSSS